MQLVPTPISPDLKTAGADIQQGIESGEIVGLGVVVIVKGGRFFVDAFGSMVRNPYASRGFVAELSDCLHEIGQRKKSVNTTL